VWKIMKYLSSVLSKYAELCPGDTYPCGAPVSLPTLANWKLPMSFMPCGAMGVSSNSTSGLPTTVDMSVPAPSK
jgi:hypothetical protein